MQKLYCYVDETGQDTEGRTFIVAVVVLGSDKDACFSFCEQVEQSSGKGKSKWGKAEHRRRTAYLRLIFNNDRFKGNLRFAMFRGRSERDHDAATIEAIARAVRFREPTEKYTTRVYVDGLSKTKRHEYANGLRHQGVPTQKVRGVLKDENNALVRLADAVAGFVRDVLDGDEEDLRQLFDQARRTGVVIQV